jgi:hypothetical protein
LTITVAGRDLGLYCFERAHLRLLRKRWKKRWDRPLRPNGAVVLVITLAITSRLYSPGLEWTFHDARTNEQTFIAGDGSSVVFNTGPLWSMMVP